MASWHSFLLAFAQHISWLYIVHQCGASVLILISAVRERLLLEYFIFFKDNKFWGAGGVEKVEQKISSGLDNVEAQLSPYAIFYCISKHLRFPRA